ncbi:MAG TPA: class I SAM-dependent methyltransferase [Nostocaceae cyanobacterium]|nr:class I SAM-dependent methyltransferase [Nostocaceae cyanobacterium]
MQATANEYSLLQPYLSQKGILEDGILTFTGYKLTPTKEANSYYFSHPLWTREYLEYCHRDEKFRSLWQAAMGSWDNKIVVDIGCGPGNVLATLGGSPRMIIGVDIAKGGLQVAKELGYIPVLADAHQMPFVSGFADIVTLSATLHHCDNMAQVLAEAARLVRPGGMLISDRDQQLSSLDFKGISLLLWKYRRQLRKLFKPGIQIDPEQQKWMVATEIHAEYPGDGVTPELYYNVLEPMGFTVNVYPHNNNVGAAALTGNYGRPIFRWRALQMLSGINPNSPAAAMSLMCVAVKNK